MYLRASSLHFRNAFLAVLFNYASYRKCFHNGNSRASRRLFSCGSYKGPATSSSSPCSVVSVCAVCATGWSQCTLSFWLYVARPFYNKSIICFNKICVNMCEKKDFLKALMPCRGSKIIIYPAGSFTKYWSRISNFCFHLEFLCVDGHMFHFQLFCFFAYEVIFRNVERKKYGERVLCLLCFFLARAHTSLMEEVRWSHAENSPLWVVTVGREDCFLETINVCVLVTYLWQSLTTVRPVSKQR